MLRPTKHETKKIQLDHGYYAFRLVSRSADGEAVRISPAQIKKPAGFEVYGKRVQDGISLTEEDPVALVKVFDSSATIEIEFVIAIDRDFASIIIDVEPIGSQNTILPVKSPEPKKQSLVRLSGHLEGLGDVDLDTGRWLGKRSGASRVEGFCIHWDNKPKDIDLIYGCLVSGNAKAPSSVTGGFVGTRQRAAPITGLWIDLRGAAREEYVLDFHLSFSRSGVLVGKPGKLMSGLGVRDHLVGLAVSVQKRT